MRKVFNNIFVKNLPNDVTDDEMRALFAPFGNITSLYKGTSEKEGKHFYFICFGSTNKNDIEYGPRAAAEAVNKLHD
jgi:RNA recognition motif-containing protein